MAVTSVPSAAADTAIAANNPGRKFLSIENTDANVLYLVLGEGTPSATNFTVSLSSGDYYEVPAVVVTYPVRGIWALDGAGAALVTEL